jgi:hypothetical protein
VAGGPANAAPVAGKFATVCGAFGLVLGLISQVKELVGPFASGEKQAAALAAIVTVLIIGIVTGIRGWRTLADKTKIALVAFAGAAIFFLGLGVGYAIYGSTFPQDWRYQIAANRNGVPLFTDTAGTAAAAVPRIPYGAKVEVSCKRPNEVSGMAAVSYWYRLAGPQQWENLYAPSDVFSNGDLVGSSGITNVDRGIPDC